MNAYPHLLQPLKIRSFTLKNRIESANSMPHFLQGPEKYPSESIIRHFANRAKNGAAIVAISGINTALGSPNFPDTFDMSHFPYYDIYDAECQNYLVQLTEMIHCYDSLVSAGLFTAIKIFPYRNPDGTMELINGRNNPGETAGDFFADYVDDGVSKETLEKIAVSHGQQAAHLKRLGFDMVTLHFAYRAQLAGQFLAPKTNRRTDEFNGSLENRARFPLMILKSIREAVGKDFLIEVQVSGDDPIGGLRTDEIIEFLRMAEPYIDIAQIRGGNGDKSGLASFEPKRYPYLDSAAAIKAAGLHLVITNVGGWSNPDDAERALAEGKLDMVTMARAFIADPDYGAHVYEGRSEDVTPCLRCNRCHGRGRNDPFATVCSVNPLSGLEQYEDMLTKPAAKPQRVAVIGGGPGGMRTAIFLADRGHKVTLYEKEPELGGLIRHADHVDFKWTLKDYKDYLIRQVKKRAITVQLNANVSPEEIQGKYDAVVAAVGSHPVLPPIPGVDGKNVVFALDVLMETKSVGQNVVVIGGGEIGVETGMFLAKQGKIVTVLEMRPELAMDSTLIHYRNEFQEAWESIPNFHAVVSATATEISAEGVHYLDKDGKVCFLPAESVVLSAGMAANREEALAFYGAADRFFMIGDCKKPGNIQTVNRSALGAAIML